MSSVARSEAWPSSRTTSPSGRWLVALVASLGVKIGESKCPFTGIERFARDNGYAEVDVRVLDEAKSFFGM